MPQILLTKAIVKHLGELGYQQPSHLKTPSSAWTLKSTILNGHADVAITNRNSFEVTITERQFAECLYADFYYGYERILKQNNCLPIPGQQINVYHLMKKILPLQLHLSIRYY